MSVVTSLTERLKPNWGLPDWSDTPVGRALSAWRRSLHVCLPPKIQRWLLQRQAPRLIMVLGERGGAQLLQELGDERTMLTNVQNQPDGELTLQIPRPRTGWQETIIELPATAVLTRPLTLPSQVTGNLRQVLGYEADRLTPFQGSALYYDAQPTEPAPRGGKLKARLALCRRDRVDDWLYLLRQLGAPPARITWPGAWKGANLLPPEQRHRPKRLGVLIDLGLVVILVAMVAVAMLTPLWQKERQLQELNSSLRHLRAEAEQVPVVREELESARTGSIAVLERKAQQPRMIDLLRELTDVLPDATWVQTVNVNDDQVDIRGESDKATELLTILEQAAGISNVSFRSPVMQVSGTGKERFHIAFRYQRPQS